MENERGNARAAEVGQLIKLDPRQPDDPLVWSVKDSRGLLDHARAARGHRHRRLRRRHRVRGRPGQTGAVRWTFELPPPTWQSAVIVDDTLIQGDCEGGLHAYDVSDTTVEPPELWTVQLEGCIESTPAAVAGPAVRGHPGRPLLRHRRPPDAADPAFCSPATADPDGRPRG